MNEYINDEHVRKLMLEGNLDKYPATVSAKAEEYLKQSFPWNTRTTTWILNWDAIPSKRLRWSEATDDETMKWVMDTAAGRCSLGLLLYTAEQPCLVGDFEFLVRHLDELVWKAPGNRLLFGVDRSLDGELVFEHGVIELNGKGDLRGSY